MESGKGLICNRIWKDELLLAVTANGHRWAKKEVSNNRGAFKRTFHIAEVQDQGHKEPLKNILKKCPA